MQARLIGVVPGEHDFREFVIFGYCTKGLPGVEVIAPAKWAKTTKEKVIFLCRQLGLKLPLKRFVLCIEEVEGIIRPHELRYLEFPLLTLLFSLADFIPLRRTENVLVSGKVESNGLIGIPRQLESRDLEVGVVLSIDGTIPVERVFECYQGNLKFRYLSNNAEELKLTGA